MIEAHVFLHDRSMVDAERVTDLLQRTPKLLHLGLQRLNLRISLRELAVVPA
jgi:hypothetical protein